MQTKEFLITFEFDKRTRWLFSEKDLRLLLLYLAQSAGRNQTAGAEPHIMVLDVTDSFAFMQAKMLQENEPK